METIGKPQGWKGRVAKWIVGFTLASFGSVYAGISIFTADRLTRPTNHPSRFDPRALGRRRTTVVDANIRPDHAAWLVPTDARTAAPDRAGARDVELVARDGVAGARPAPQAVSTCCSSTSAGMARATRRGCIWAAASAPIFELS